MTARTIHLIDPLTDTIIAEGAVFTDGRVVFKSVAPNVSELEYKHYTTLEEAQTVYDVYRFVYTDRAELDKAMKDILEGLGSNYPHAPREALVSKGSIRDWLFDKAANWRDARPIVRAVDKWFPKFE